RGVPAEDRVDRRGARRAARLLSRVVAESPRVQYGSEDAGIRCAPSWLAEGLFPGQVPRRFRRTRAPNPDAATAFPAGGRRDLRMAGRKLGIRELGRGEGMTEWHCSARTSPW